MVHFLLQFDKHYPLTELELGSAWLQMWPPEFSFHKEPYEARASLSRTVPLTSNQAPPNQFLLPSLYHYTQLKFLLVIFHELSASIYSQVVNLHLLTSVSLLITVVFNKIYFAISDKCLVINFCFTKPNNLHRMINSIDLKQNRPKG